MSSSLCTEIYFRFASPHNQRVTDALIERIMQEHVVSYDAKDIKSMYVCVHVHNMYHQTSLQHHPW